MTLETDLNVSPYFDNYDETKNHHKVLFKPSEPVQSKELNQLQQILQNQVERFGETIIERGSIIKGGNFYDYRNLSYVKISDDNIRNQPIVIGNYIGAELVGENSGVRAIVVTSISGYESKSPDLNTVYVKYTQTGKDAFGVDIKTFIPGETLLGYVNGVRNEQLDVNVTTFGVDSNPIGMGYAVSCGEGILFQKGYFINFYNQIVIVSKYNTTPDAVSVGFVTDEQIVNFNTDVTLRDNAFSSNNFRAPGADRMKLTPRLVVYTTEQANDDYNFLGIQNYENGLLINKRTGTTLSKQLSSSIESRTYEESGNYTVVGHEPQIVSKPGLNSEPCIVISAGTSYVNGRKIETVNKMFLDLNEAIDNDGNQIGQISTAMGGYINASFFKFFHGLVSPNGQTINLLDAEQASGETVGNIIGTAVVLHIDNAGNGIYRVYLTNIRMNSGSTFSQVKSMAASTNTFGANFILEAGKAVIKDGSKSTLVYRTNVENIGSLSFPMSYETYRRLVGNYDGNGYITINAPASTVFPYAAGADLSPSQLSEIMLGFGIPNGIMIPESGVVSSDRTSVTLYNSASVGSSNNGSAYMPIEFVAQGVTPKELATVYMKINANGVSAGSPLYLGWPDVHSIEGVWRGSNTTFTEASAGITNVTDKFILNKNISSTNYGISYLKTKSGYNIGSTDRYLVKAKVFTRPTVSAGFNTFFAVTSYPIDDTTAVLPANKIRSSELEEEIRNTIDFRFTIPATAAYSTSASGATISTLASNLNNTTFPTVLTNLPVFNKTLDLGIEYKLPRVDSILINDKGSFVIKRGIPSESPRAPYVTKSNMVLANINVPAGKLIMPSAAIRSGSDDKVITINSNENRRYTMSDINDMNSRVDNLEYYAILSAQELGAENMVIKGADGLDRFKNGIFVENFESLLAADVKNEDFSASVDPSENVLYPSFKAYNLDMEINSNTSDVLLKTDTASLKFRETVLDQQQIATKFRNCVTDFYDFTGIGFIHPEYDFGYDETTAPSINKTIDMVGAFSEYTAQLNEIVPLKSSKSTTTSNTKVIGRDVDRNTTVNTSSSVNGRATTTTTTTSTTTEVATTRKTTNKTVTDTSTLVMSGTNTTKQDVGDFVTDIQFSPYLRQQVLRMAFFGLRPNTRFWAWFDGQPVSQFCAPGILEGDDISKVKRIGKFAAPLRSDSNGELIILFSIPKDRFFVGEREFTVIDVEAMNSADSATSRSVVTYRGFNFSVEKTGLEISTRTPTYDIAKSRNVTTKSTTSTTVTSNTQTSSTSTTVVAPAPVVRRPTFREGDGGEGRGDPIAQTFTVANSITDAENVMVTKIDVSFKKKSASLGITLQLRKTVNGFPGEEILPFGSIRLPSSAVKVSDNGVVMTSFVFKSPVSLSVGETYSYVLLPDGNSPDYQVFCSKVGETGLVTGIRHASDTHTGTLFTSTNNMAWTPYQDENMKFIIWRAEYTSKTGSLDLRLKNYEFFDLETVVGDFRRGETVFAVRQFMSGTISTTAGSRVVNANGIDLRTLFRVGEYIAIYNQEDDTHDVSRISSIINATSMTLDEYMTDNLTSRRFFKTVIGVCDYFNKKEPIRLFLKNSSAATGNVFSDGIAIKGETSNAAAIIKTVIDLPLSYYQPDIQKTEYNNATTRLSLVRQTNSAGNITTQQLSQNFNQNNRLTNMNTVIRSRSSELVENGGTRSFLLRVDLAITGTAPFTVSPTVDFGIAGLTAYEYKIEPNSVAIANSEKMDGGLASSKYMSKMINLREGFDAEDLNLWLTAYKPTNCEINVYAKVISDIDERSLSEIAWTRMVLQDDSNFVSSSTNFDDFKEFAYKLPTTVAGPNGGAFVNGNQQLSYIDDNGGYHENFKKFIIKIVFNSAGQQYIPKVKDIRAIALS